MYRPCMGAGFHALDEVGADPSEKIWALRIPFLECIAGHRTVAQEMCSRYIRACTAPRYGLGGEPLHSFDVTQW